MTLPLFSYLPFSLIQLPVPFNDTALLQKYNLLGPMFMDRHFFRRIRQIKRLA